MCLKAESDVLHAAACRLLPQLLHQHHHWLYRLPHRLLLRWWHLSLWLHIMWHSRHWRIMGPRFWLQ